MSCLGILEFGPIATSNVTLKSLDRIRRLASFFADKWGRFERRCFACFGLPWFGNLVRNEWQPATAESNLFEQLLGRFDRLANDAGDEELRMLYREDSLSLIAGSELFISTQVRIYQQTHELELI